MFEFEITSNCSNTEARTGIFHTPNGQVNTPRFMPVGTLAIGQAGAKNAALLAAQILALSDLQLAHRIQEWRATQTANVAEAPE